MTRREGYTPIPALQQGLKVRRICVMPSGEMYVTATDETVYLWSRVCQCWVRAS